MLAEPPVQWTGCRQPVTGGVRLMPGNLSFDAI